MEKPLFLFAPGAGAPSSHPWMQRWKQYLATIGDVVTFDYAYMQEGRRRPDPLPMLIAAHRKALLDARGADARAAIVIGKSMGGRVGCHVALKEKVEAVICLSYPLCGGGDPSKLRDKVLRELQTPILFVQGTRDSLCPLELLEQVRAEMTAPSFLHIVAGGDHSLLVTKTQLRAAGETQDDVDRRIVGEIAAFLQRLKNA
ncbi:MAG: alpha/beta hydrolase [Chthoniobacterales bacterium]|nr:MAG: alpha/beta hydrolase [Chthoniobacterales bacterium]